MRDRQGSVTVLVSAFASPLVSVCCVHVFRRLFDGTTGPDSFFFFYDLFWVFFVGEIDFWAVWCLKMEQQHSVLSR